MTVKVLFVDDEKNVVDSMHRLFRRDPFEVITALSGQEALEIMANKPVQVLVSDQNMPSMTGISLFNTVKELYPETLRIMLTGQSDVDTILKAVNSGAVYKFIVKPWNKEEFRQTVAHAVDHYNLVYENKQLHKQKEIQEKQIQQLSRLVDKNHSQLDKMLEKKGLITSYQVEEALSVQKQTNRILSEILVTLKIISEETLLQVIEAELHLNRIFLEKEQMSPEASAALPQDICRQNWVIPIKKENGRLLLAMADPTDFDKLDALKAIAGIPIHPALASISEISKAMECRWEDSDNYKKMTERISRTPELFQLSTWNTTTSNDEARRGLSDGAIAKMVDTIIHRALDEDASDIHIEPKNSFVMVRYRIDGLLFDKMHYSINLHQSVVSRIKVMSELDISERRHPQDGRIALRTAQRNIDIRISTLPTIAGEKVVLRLLDRSLGIKKIENLGLSPNDMNRLSTCMKLPQGILLVTGPTGSGKTSTLYSMIHRSATLDKNFVTIEEPVEYLMELAEQVNIHEKIDLGFASALRAILRQDPNVILLGEIRDLETAEVAFQGALTGHLILSTLHTNSAVASITRLEDIGVKPYIISEALVGVVGQRLVRKLCSKCKVKTESTIDMLRSLNIDKKTWNTVVYSAGRGCEHCHFTGYEGRIGVFEVLQVDPELKGMIRAGLSENEIYQASLAGGMTAMLDDAISKVKNGLTSFEEVLRVFGPQRMIDLECPKCKTTMTERFRFCPICAHDLGNRCKGCQKMLNPKWNACPDCGLIRDVLSVIPSSGHCESHIGDKAP